MTVAAVIVAGGSGSRFNKNLPKQYHFLDERVILQQTLDTFLQHSQVNHILVVIGANDHIYYEKFIGKDHQKLLPPVVGGETRQASVFAGLKALKDLNPDFVLVHDAARPFVSSFLIDRVLTQLTPTNGCIPALPITETVKKITISQQSETQQVETTISRDQLCLAQTPQGFPYPLLLKAHEKFQTYPGFTDDAALFEEMKLPVMVCQGDPFNIKITYPEDLKNVPNHP